MNNLEAIITEMLSLKEGESFTVSDPSPSYLRTIRNQLYCYLSRTNLTPRYCLRMRQSGLLVEARIHRAPKIVRINPTINTLLDQIVLLPENEAFSMIHSALSEGRLTDEEAFQVQTKYLEVHSE